MRCLSVTIVAVTALASANLAVAQQAALPQSAKLTRDANGNVTGLRITGPAVQDRLDLAPKTIAALSDFKELDSLSLWGTTVDDNDIKQLAGLEKLLLLDLAFTNVTGESLQTLSSFEKLYSLRLEGCDVKDEHLAQLAKMPQLGMLYLGRTKVTDAGLKHIRKLKKLDLLQLSDCHITDAGLASLGDLPAIRTLLLSKTIRYGQDDRSELTDDCIDYLISLDTLTRLQIADSKLTETGLQKLREGLPKTKITTERIGVTYSNKKPEPHKQPEKAATH